MNRLILMVAPRFGVSFTIEGGYQLDALILELFVTDPDTNLGFIDVAAGNVFPTSLDVPDPTTLHGYGLVGLGDVGKDILQLMGTGAGSQGCSGPLGAGACSWRAQETGPSTDDWDLNFVVSAPGALALLGLGGLAARRRRA